MAQPTLTVLCLGNLLLADEGVSLHILSRLRDVPLPAGVQLIDGGTGGVDLLPYLEESAQVLVVDAADMRLPPGEYRVFTPDQVRDLDPSESLSLHETGILGVVALAQTLGRCAPVRIVGIQPASVAPGMDLSGTLADKLDTYLAVVRGQIDDLLAIDPPGV